MLIARLRFALLILIEFMMPSSAEPEVPEAIRRMADSDDWKLGRYFSIFFSRFEYALKRHPSFLSASGEARPNWDRFASDYTKIFQPSSTRMLESAVSYFKVSPPLKQIVENGQMTWSAPEKYNGRDALLPWLLCAIRRVRNNLFHGGKFDKAPVSDPSRDPNLMFHAIVILSGCLKLDSSVEKNFYENLDE